ncbi:MAG: DNA translocase FtsK, partial [Syntrophomonadaceae bacterium]|nr:DNA translocase FtsK [Syntrophomonadaceae bacterium]
MAKKDEKKPDKRKSPAKGKTPARSLKTATGKGKSGGTRSGPAAKKPAAKDGGVRNELWAVLFLTLAVFLFLAVRKYGGMENSEMYIGWLGNMLLRGLERLMGEAVALLPVFLTCWSIHIFVTKKMWSLRMSGLLLLVMSWLLFKSCYDLPANTSPWKAAGYGLGGGYLGGALALGFTRLLGEVGTGIIIALAMVMALIMVLNRSLVELFQLLWQGVKKLWSLIDGLIWIDEDDEYDQPPPAPKKASRRPKDVDDDGESGKGNGSKQYEPVQIPEPLPRTEILLPQFVVTPATELRDDEALTILNLPEDDWLKEAAAEAIREEIGDEALPLADGGAQPGHQDMEEPDIDGAAWPEAESGAEETKIPVKAAPAVYRIPSPDILSDVTGDRTIDKKHIRDSIEKLEDTFASFGVGVKVNEVSCGPAVTRYELTPAPGVKVSRIISLTDDLQLSLAAPGIRIEAPIPGKSAIGIEVPNSSISSVGFKRLLTSPGFKRLQSPLAVVLGEDISGNAVVAKLSDMPHLLIAGSTGSGKSVCMNALIMSLLYNASPDDLKLVFIDPKMVELTVYNGIPHLMTPVVTDAKKASVILRWMTNEMEKRYKIFADAGVRDIYRYNQIAAERMPFIVIMIDELADLMMVAPHEVEDSICRLAQMARAAGMHLIVATQRPSVDVVTGIIKANIPSRIAFAVSSQADSRTILDMGGADKLIGRGDMLFFPVGAVKPQRVQGAFVTDADIEATVEFIKSQSSTEVLQQQSQQMENAMESISYEVAADEWDDLFWEAARVLVES